MRLKYLFLIVLGIFTLQACNNSEENNSTKGKAKIEEVKENKTPDNQVQDAVKTTPEQEKTVSAAEKNVFEGTFVDASVLDMAYYLFFKDAQGKEQSFYYNPQKNPIEMPVQFLDANLSVNKELVGKKFSIKFKTEEREDDNTGEMTTFYIPTEVKEK